MPNKETQTDPWYREPEVLHAFLHDKRIAALVSTAVELDQIDQTLPLAGRENKDIIHELTQERLRQLGPTKVLY